MSATDRDRIRDYYDRYGEIEWTRLTQTPSGRINFEVHKRMLDAFVSAGDEVLEIGAGPGRFTLELGGLEARTLVTDLSPVQLDLNVKFVGDTPFETFVQGRELLDVTDVSRFADDTFDAVVAFGGPLSYAFENAEAAFAGLVRITKPGGVVLASVMSMLGAWRHFLRGVVEEATKFGETANDAVLRTGDLRHLPSDHVCRMFRASEVAVMVSATGAELESISASNWASLGDSEALEILAWDAQRWSNFVRHELQACREPGALDGGTHIVFAARKPL